jgi:hypothetical protein
MEAPPRFGYSAIVDRQVVPARDLSEAAAEMAEAYRRQQSFDCRACWKPRTYRALHPWERQRLLELATQALS